MKHSLFQSIKTNKEKVRQILIQYEHLRDDDFKLISYFYYMEAGGIETTKKSAFTWLQEFSNHKYTSPESIRRIRQKLQEQNPELRGDTYIPRQKEGKIVSSQINKI